MWLVVGLGNPGAKYENNRHNIGFMVVDALARAHNLSAWADKLGAETTAGFITVPSAGAASGGAASGGAASGGAASGGNDRRERAVLVKPMEFMNLSGFAVQRAAQFHKVAIENILVVHDEIDLGAGIVRLKSAGGHGGHNGLRSITEQVGANFQRLRMGVGRDPNHPPGSKDAAGWVLADFPKAHADSVTKMISAGCEDVAAVLALGIKDAMNKHNARPSLFPSG